MSGGMALELPLTLRIKIDIEPKVLHVDTAEHGENVGFGDTKFALRAMLLESNTLSLSTGSVISVPNGGGGSQVRRRYNYGGSATCLLDGSGTSHEHTFLSGCGCSNRREPQRRC